MNFQCPKCKWIHRLASGNPRPPAQCQMCGAVIKLDDDLPIKPEFANTASSPRQVGKPMASLDPAVANDHEERAGRGWILMVLGLLIAACTWLYASTSVTTEGQVEVSTMQIDEATGEQTPRPNPVLVVRYAVAGKRYEFVIDRKREMDFEPGMTVPVLYRSSDPARGQLGDNYTLYYGAGMMVVIGSGLFIWSWISRQ